MGKAISIGTLNRFIAYPYLVIGWGNWSEKKLPNKKRQYSIYEMITPELVELVPLAPILIEDTTMPSGEHTRIVYQHCTYSGEWVTPFEKGCVKSLREIVQALEAMELLLPEYWETSSEGGKARNMNRESLQSSSACAYNLLSERYALRRGNRIMAKTSNGAVVEVEQDDDTDDKPKKKSGISLMNECYSEMFRAKDVSLYGLKVVYDYLERTVGSTKDGVELLTRFDRHINSKKTVYSGINEPITISEFINHLRSWNTPEEAVELMTAGILAEAQDSFELEAVLAEIQKPAESIPSSK